MGMLEYNVQAIEALIGLLAQQQTAQLTNPAPTAPPTPPKMADAGAASGSAI